MGAGQRLAAGGGELNQDGGEQPDVEDDLHVAELPHVVVPALERAPADEDVGRALQRPLSGDHPGAVVIVLAGAEVGLVHRRTGLLDLQEQGVVAAAALKEGQVDPHAHATHPHDLADQVNGSEAIEQVASILLQGHPVAGQELVGQRVLLVVVDGDADGWGLVDSRPAVDHRGELGERAVVGAALGPLLDVDQQLPTVGRREVLDQTVDVSPVVPEVELRHRRVAGHLVPVGFHCRDHGLIGRGRLEAILPRRHHQAGGESLHVPLKGPGQRLVEVAQVEQEVALWRGPQTKIEDVGVAAELDPQPAVGPGREIGGHHGGRSAVVVPRRGHHASMSDGEQLGDPDGVLGQDRIEGIVPASGLVPMRPRAPWSLLSGGLAGRAAFLDGLPKVMRRGRCGRGRGRVGIRHEGRSSSRMDGRSAEGSLRVRCINM